MPSRRQVLAAGSLALAGGSGCARIRDAVADGSGDETTGGTTTSATAETSEETDASEATGGDGDDASEFRIAVTADDGEVELVTGADVAEVGEVEQARGGDGYQLSMELTDDGTAAFADGLERVGALDNPDSHRIRTYFEGETLYEAMLAPGFVNAVESGEWDGEFLFQVSERETAEEVKEALEGS